MNRKLMAMPFLAIFGLMLLQMGSMETQTVEAATIEEDEIAQFLTCYLDNVSAHIAPASAAMHASSGDLLDLEETGRVIHLFQVGVTAGTMDYSRAEFVRLTGRENTVHYLTDQQIQEYANYKDKQSSISLLGATTALNDTSEASGTNMLGEVDYEIKDMKGETNFNTNSSDYVTWPTVEPQYQAYAAILEANSTLTQFDIDKSDQKILHVAQIANVENTMLSILEANIAANQSTTSDTITPDRVTILDYDFNMTDPRAAVMDLYLKKSFSDRIRGAVSDYESSKASAQANYALVIFGFKVVEWKGPVRVGAFGFFDGVGEIINIAEAIVTAPITAVDMLPELYDTYGVGAAINIGSGIVDACLSAPSAITQSVGEGINTFTSTCGLGANLGEALGNAGKVANSAFSTVVGGFTGILSSLLPYLLIGGGLLIAGVAIYFFLLKPRMGASKSDDIVPY